MGAPPLARVSIPALPDSGSGWIEEVCDDPAGLRLVVRYAAPRAPALAVGRSGELEVRGEPAAEAPEGGTVVIGKVVARHEREGGRAYHFLLGDRSRSALAPLLEPRSADRVLLGDEVRAELTLPGPAGGGAEVLTGIVRDLSRDGACVEVPWEGEAALCEHEHAALSLHLEGGPPLGFTARIRSRRLVPGAIRLGLALSSSCDGSSSRGGSSSLGGSPAVGGASGGQGDLERLRAAVEALSRAAGGAAGRASGRS